MYCWINGNDELKRKEFFCEARWRVAPNTSTHPANAQIRLRKKTSICPFLNPLYLFLNVSRRERDRERERERDRERERERLGEFKVLRFACKIYTMQ